MATANKTNSSRRISVDDSLSILDMVMICVHHWFWFAISLTVCLGTTWIYLKTVPLSFTRSTSILVKNSGEKSNDIKLIEELGVNNLTSNISDEIVAIHSPAAIYTMVRRLHLDVSYYRHGFFRDEPLYAESLPVEVEFPDIDDNAQLSFNLTLNGDSTVTLTKLVMFGKETEMEQKVKIGEETAAPFGQIIVKPTLYYKDDARGEILVNRIGYMAAARIYGGRITARLHPNTNNIIDIACVDNSIPRADNILKIIVNIYNENWVQNRNQISVSTNEFIKERLAVIEDELGDVEQNIAGYKSSHAMMSAEAVAGQAMGQESSADQQRQLLSNQIYMLRYVRNYVSDPANAKQLLPAGAAIGSPAVETQISTYNAKLLQRNNLVSNSSENNPLVADLDIELENLRRAILSSLDNAQMTLNTQLTTVMAAHSQALSKLTAAPQQANHLLSIERQQKVKESLYLFLLQKREENELSQAFTAYNTRIIAEPWGSNLPTSPDSQRIMLIALGIALAVPAAFFILREVMNSKVRGRKDLENLSIPYVGELPLWKPQNQKKLILGKLKKEEEEVGYKIVVQQHKRDITNEAFRVVRTNLEFMINGQTQLSSPDKQRTTGQIIMLTSFNPGSGKTFITANLGASFGIRGSKVICVDLDFRRGSLSEFVGSPKQGLTNYLGGQADSYKEMIAQLNVNKDESGDENKNGNIDFLPMGKMPPNPTELLYSPRLKPMLDELRQQYDYIFVDCPPVDIVADATIISREADVTLFIVRAGLLERNMLPELEKNYEEKKYNNMAIILNGTDAVHHYGYHRYGYGYGRYGYGKRYGYGYYGSSKSKK